MTKQIEAMKLALDALEDVEAGQQKVIDAITALRAALDEPVQERRVQQQFMDEEVLYSAPPRREWVSLTSGEQTEIIERYYDDEIDFHDFARAIEAKLKEKNCGS